MRRHSAFVHCVLFLQVVLTDNEMLQPARSLPPSPFISCLMSFSFTLQFEREAVSWQRGQHEGVGIHEGSMMMVHGNSATEVSSIHFGSVFVLMGAFMGSQKKAMWPVRVHYGDLKCTMSGGHCGSNMMALNGFSSIGNALESRTANMWAEWHKMAVVGMVTTPSDHQES